MGTARLRGEHEQWLGDNVMTLLQPHSMLHRPQTSGNKEKSVEARLQGVGVQSLQ